MPYGTLGNLRGGTRVCLMARSDGKGLISNVYLIIHQPRKDSFFIIITLRLQPTVTVIHLVLPLENPKGEDDTVIFRHCLRMVFFPSWAACSNNVWPP